MKWDWDSFKIRFGLRTQNGDGDGDGTAAAAAAAGYGVGNAAGYGGASGYGGPAGTSGSVGWGGGMGGTDAGPSGGGGQTSVGYGSVGAGNTGTATGYGATAYGGGTAARGGTSAAGGVAGAGGGGAATGGGGGTAAGGSASGPGGFGLGGSASGSNALTGDARLRAMINSQINALGAQGMNPATVNALREAALMGVPSGYATGVETATHPISVSALGPPSAGPSGNVAVTPGNEGANSYNAMTSFVNSLRNAYSEGFPAGTANMGAPAAGIASVRTGGMANMGFPAYGVEGNIGVGVPGYASAGSAPPGSSIGTATMNYGPATPSQYAAVQQYNATQAAMRGLRTGYGTTGFSNAMAQNVMQNANQGGGSGQLMGGIHQ